MSPRSDAALAAAADPQLVTPTGLFVTDADPGSDEWLAARRKGITATDIPKILIGDETTHGNAISVWMDKQGQWDDDLGEAAMWGQVLEEPIAAVWSRQHGTETAPLPVLCHVVNEWMVASLDRIVRDCPTGEATAAWGCALEVKTRNAFVAGNWRDDVPDDVLAQVAWQRLVSGFGHVHVACLIGGQRLVQHTYRRDAELERYLLIEAGRVWRHVLDGTRPIAPANALLTAVLNKLYPDRDGVLSLVSADEIAEALDVVDAYEDARLAEAAAKADKDAAKSRIVERLGPHEVALVDGKPVFSYRANRNGVRSLLIARDIRKDQES